MKIILKIFFLFWAVSIARADLPSATVESFAHGLLNTNNTFVGLLTRSSPKTRHIDIKNGDSITYEESEIFETTHFVSTFQEVLWNSCHKTSKLVTIFPNRNAWLDGAPAFISGEGHVWLVVLMPFFDEKHEISETVNPGWVEWLDLKKLEPLKFLNNENAFLIPFRNKDHLINIKWTPRNNDPRNQLPKNTPVADELFVSDLKKLSLLFCGEKYEFIDGIEGIQKLLPTLQTDMGKLIAKKMIEILETKAIDAAKAAQNIGDTTKILK